MTNAWIKGGAVWWYHFRAGLYKGINSEIISFLYSYCFLGARMEIIGIFKRYDGVVFMVFLYGFRTVCSGSEGSKFWTAVCIVYGAE